MKQFLCIIGLLITCFQGVCQVKRINEKVKLIKWSSEACDNTYDAYRLKTRITNIESTDTTTIFTINFSDNCCAVFNPVIKFYDHKLVLLPYTNWGRSCSCDCCFTLRYEVSGLAGKTYQLYFKENKITQSRNYYDTVPPSCSMYNGSKINCLNKYGFKEGTWITFYKDGKKETISEYPGESLYQKPDAIFTKGYYPSGKLSFYDRKDTSESWFENQELEFQWIVYKNGDTTYTKGFNKFENGKMQKEFVEAFYPTVFKSEFYPEYEAEGGIAKTVYKREHFKNGRLKYVVENDSSYTWFETGEPELKSYKDGYIRFDRKGRMTERAFNWKTAGAKMSRDLDNALYVAYYINGNVKNISFVRDEPADAGLGRGIRFTWKWDQSMKLIESPKKWKEPLPWKRFKEIKLPSKMYSGLK